VESQLVPERIESGVSQLGCRAVSEDLVERRELGHVVEMLAHALDQQKGFVQERAVEEERVVPCPVRMQRLIFR